MNSDLSYFDVFYNIEILHLNDFNEFENEINKKLEKKTDFVEPTFETLNLGNDENPCLIKIGLTLSKKERKDLQELLTKFQEVFAWSYEDIDRAKSDTTREPDTTNPFINRLWVKVKWVWVIFGLTWLTHLINGSCLCSTCKPV